MLKLNNDNCIIIDNKFYLYINEESTNLPLKKIGSGTEADVYIFKGNILFKIYKQELLDEKLEIYNENRICEISEKRNIIKKTKLTFGPVYINGEFRGAAVYYHRLAPNFNYVTLIPSDNYVIDRFDEVLTELNEFEKNNMYYMDLNPKNILLPRFKSSQIIDCDGKSICLCEDKDNYCKKIMYDGFRDLMLEKLFDVEFEVLEEYKNVDLYLYLNKFDELIDEVSDQYGISEEFRNEFKSTLLNYEILKNFLNYLKKDKILSKKLVK